MITDSLVLRATLSPKTFRNVLRPLLYKLNDNDPEKVHEYAKHLLNKISPFIERQNRKFDYGDEFKINFYGRHVKPLVVAEGFDKDCEVLRPLTYVADVQLPGTIMVEPRPGNPQPRVAVDAENGNSWNAQGFPSKGLKYAFTLLEDYMVNTKNRSLIVPSICGVPPLDENISVSKKLEIAYEQFLNLAGSLQNYSFGQIWNPASPNTASLPMLRTRETAKQYAAALKGILKDKPAFMKIPPMVDTLTEEIALDMVSGWEDSGGDGIVVNNTKIIKKEEEPHLKDFAYGSAGLAGNDLYPYTKKGVDIVHRTFPDLFIIAEGGITTPERSFELYTLGANMQGFYTPLMFNGLGHFIQIADGVKKIMRRLGYTSLEELIEKRMLN